MLTFRSNHSLYLPCETPNHRTINWGNPLIIRDLILALLRDQKAATAVEYGLIISLIVIAMIASMQSLATQIIDMSGTVETNVTSV